MKQNWWHDRDIYVDGWMDGSQECRSNMYVLGGITNGSSDILEISGELGTPTLEIELETNKGSWSTELVT